MKTGNLTTPGFENADNENFYQDFPKVHIDAIYQNGKFLDFLDKNPVNLVEGSYVRIVAYKKDVLEEQRKKFETVEKIVLEAGIRLSFKLQGKDLSFDCFLLEPLVFVKDGNKPSVAATGACEVRPSFESRTKDFKPFRVRSLNQAYFRISTMFNTDARSHTVNVYKRFYVDGKILLEHYRF